MIDRVKRLISRLDAWTPAAPAAPDHAAGDLRVPRARGPQVRRQHGLLRRPLDLPAPGPRRRGLLLLPRRGSGARVRRRDRSCGHAARCGDGRRRDRRDDRVARDDHDHRLRLPRLGRARHLLGARQRRQPRVRARAAAAVPEGQAHRPDCSWASPACWRWRLLVIGIVTGILQSAASRLAVEVPGRETGGLAHRPRGADPPDLPRLLVIYRVVPNRRVTWGEVLPGAIVATMLWTVLRFGFTWYATSVASYDSAFGPLSTGITLIVFLYFASVIVLLGAEFARATHARRRDRADRARRPAPPAGGHRSGARRRHRSQDWGESAGRSSLGAGLLGVLVGRLSKRDD